MPRTVLFILVLVFALGSCQDLFVVETPPVPIVKTVTADREVYIGFTGTKKDRDGVLQCRNYAFTKPSDSLLHLYGWNVRHTLAALLEIPVKRVALNRDSLQNRFLEVEMQRLSGQIDMSSRNERLHLVQEICSALNLEMRAQEKSTVADFIVITDPKRLSQLEVGSKSGLGMQLKAGQFSCEACRIASLANFLNANAETEFLTRVNSAQRFAFSFDYGHGDDLGKTLASLGLGLERGDTLLTHYTFE